MIKENLPDIKYVDYAAKVEYPDGKEVCIGTNADQNGCNNADSFTGYRAGVSGNVTLLKTENIKVNDKWDASVEATGPSLGGAFGAAYGSEKKVSAMVEPSLVKVEGQVGRVVGSVGLNGNTGVKVNEEGVQFGVLGFGLTLGVGNKYTIDTPFGSGGFATTAKQTEVDNNSEQIVHAS
ncbi:hypothetical protein Ocin01_13597 [Orchesella cincta]|uniref:Uncharacterized protein n=1 Tax=Orchesella cincta TaxID=48709 RepID=A0A1D2MJ70_ORCCI|nr:hypothetical protein Ocin01_13597 [Orchesella cincta]